MKREVSSYLEDIFKYSQHIVSQSASLTRVQFDNDFNMQCALIRCLEVVGEAAKRLCDTDESFCKQYPGIPWKSMARMRDLLIHHYEEANMDIVWDTIKKDVPELIAKIEHVLKKMQNDKILD